MFRIEQRSQDENDRLMQVPQMKTLTLVTSDGLVVSIHLNERDLQMPVDEFCEKIIAWAA